MRREWNPTVRLSSTFALLCLRFRKSLILRELLGKILCGCDSLFALGRDSSGLHSPIMLGAAAHACTASFGTGGFQVVGNGGCIHFSRTIARHVKQCQERWRECRC